MRRRCRPVVSGCHVDVFDQAEPLPQRLGGEAGHVAELVDEVRLVGVAECVGQTAPAGLSAQHRIECGSQPSNACVLLGREARGASEPALELADAESDVGGETSDR